MARLKTVAHVVLALWSIITVSQVKTELNMRKQLMKACGRQENVKDKVWLHGTIKVTSMVYGRMTNVSRVKWDSQMETSTREGSQMIKCMGLGDCWWQMESFLMASLIRTNVTVLVNFYILQVIFITDNIEDLSRKGRAKLFIWMVLTMKVVGRMTGSTIKAKCSITFLAMFIVDNILMASEMAVAKCTMLSNKKFTMVIGQTIVDKVRA